MTNKPEVINISNDDIKAGLLALVTEKGEDFVYSKHEVSDDYNGRCLYVHKGEPDCFIGQFLAGKGVPVERLKKADTSHPFGQTAIDLLADLQDEGLIEISWRGAQALQVAQSNQDREETWGVALTSALREF